MVPANPPMELPPEIYNALANKTAAEQRAETRSRVDYQPRDWSAPLENQDMFQSGPRGDTVSYTAHLFIQSEDGMVAIYGWELVLNRIFGETLLLNITKKTLKDYQDKIFKEQSAVSANRYQFILKQVFKKGVKIGAIVDDPVAKIKYLSEKQHERNNYLMPVSLENLVAVTQKTRAKFYMPALIYLGAEHGASRQEALSLKWSDIDFDYEGIGFINLFRTKNTKERTEFLMPRTRQALIEWKAHLEFMRHRKKIKVKNTQFVFTRLDGTPISRFDSAWRTVCKSAGIEDFHYHDLRHTFCSNLIMSGSDLKTAKDMIGHRDIAMTDRYSHLSALHKRSVQDKLAAHYAKMD